MTRRAPAISITRREDGFSGTGHRRRHSESRLGSLERSSGTGRGRREGELWGGRSGKRRYHRMDSIREEQQEEVRSVGDEAPEQQGDEELNNPSDELMKMAASLQEVLGGAGSPSPLVKKARKLLYRRLRVGVEDGRIFMGKFHCLDKQGNIILYDTTEYRQISQASSSSDSTCGAGAGASPYSMELRSLGLVLIPARCRTSCFVECPMQERQSLLSVNE
ncbi:hypothetical protein MPTK2_8g03570 [Marchantia polymorpha subsp. ruderalis]